MHRSASLPLRFSSAVSLALALVAIACHDLTAPLTPSPASAVTMTAAPVLALAVVSPGDMHDWAFVQSETGSPCLDPSACRLVAGPGVPPVGTGSAELALTRRTAPALAFRGSGGTALARITTLRYSTFTERAQHDDAASLTLRLTVDLEGRIGRPGRAGHGGADGRPDGEDHVVFRPSSSARARMRGGVWQSWDALAGSWWTDRDDSAGEGGAHGRPCRQEAPCSWASLLARYPDIALRTSASTLLFVPSSDDDLRRSESVRINVDSVVIGVDGVTTVYDFELRPRPATPPSLTVFVDADVAGSPGDLDSLYAFGAVVPYDFHAPTDGRVLTVYLDGHAAPSSGTLTMTRRHSLYAVLRADLSVQPGDQPLVDAIRAVLTTADPVAAFPALMDLVGRSYADAGEDVTDQRLARASAHAIDPLLDSAALTRIDQALGGHIFPISAPLSSAPANGARIGASASTKARAPGGAASRATITGHGTAEPTAIFYVNGVGNSFVDAAKTQGHLGFLLRQTVFRFRDPTDVVMRLVYNRNDAAQNPPSASGACFVSTIGVYGTSLPAYLICRSISMLEPVTSIVNDLREAVGMLSGKTLPASGPVVEDIRTLADSLKAYTQAGRTAIVLPHSEGNLLTERALQRLVDIGAFRPNGRPTCIAVAPMASPTTHYGPLRAAYVRPTQLAGDAILLAPSVLSAAESFPAAPNAIDDSLVAVRAARAGPTSLRLLHTLLDGAAIHSMDSYLAVRGGRAMVMAAAEEAYNACATSLVTIAGPVDAAYPWQYTMLLGSSAQYSATAFNGAGDTVTGRSVVWSADDRMASVTADGLLTAINVGSNGSLGVQVGLAFTSLNIVPWSKPPVVTAVTCTKGATRYEDRAMITTWNATVAAQPSDPRAPIASFLIELEKKQRWSNADHYVLDPFGQQNGSTATTQIWLQQAPSMDGTPEGGQWLPTGRCRARVTDIFGQVTEQYSE